MVAAQRRLHGGVFPADDQHIAAEIGVRVLEIVGNVRQFFTGNMEPSRVIRPAGGQHELVHAVSFLPAARVGGQNERIGDPIDADNRLVGPHVQVELLDDAAQVGEILLARGLGLVGRLQGDAGDGDPLVAAEEARLRREPGNRMSDLPRVEVQIIDRRFLQRDGQFNADRPGPDDPDLGLLAFHGTNHSSAEAAQKQRGANQRLTDPPRAIREAEKNSIELAPPTTPCSTRDGPSP